MASKATQDFVDKCKALFDEADKDKNGLTIQELHTVVRKLCNSDTSDRAIAEIFVGLDDDGDKKLTWEEFSDVCCKKDPKSVQENQLSEVFKGLDSDGSGRLSKDEVKTAFQKLGIRGDPEKALECADVDGDGKVSCGEFIKYWREQVA